MKKAPLLLMSLLFSTSTILFSQSFMLRDNPSITGVPAGTIASTFYQNGDKYGIGSLIPNSSLFVKTISGAGLNATLELENGDNKPFGDPLLGVYAIAPVLAPNSFLVKRTIATSSNAFGPSSYNSFTDFVIKDNGYVGVNTPTPSYNLDIAGNTRSTNLYIANNIGIGTTSPMYNLDIAGNSRSTNLYVTNKLGIGTTTPTAMLHINGGDLSITNGRLVIGNGSNQFAVSSDGRVRARAIRVDVEEIPDYVFKPNYKLMPLSELKTYIHLNNHLPNIKSEADYKNEGSVDLAELNTKLLEKVEELTLYILQMEERFKKLETK